MSARKSGIKRLKLVVRDLSLYSVEVGNFNWVMD